MHEAMIRHFPGDTFQLDPGRLVQGVMTGIGFPGAGVIVRQGVRLYGSQARPRSGSPPRSRWCSAWAIWNSAAS